MSSTHIAGNSFTWRHGSIERSVQRCIVCGRMLYDSAGINFVIVGNQINPPTSFVAGDIVVERSSPEVARFDWVGRLDCSKPFAKPEGLCTDLVE